MSPTPSPTDSSFAGKAAPVLNTRAGFDLALLVDVECVVREQGAVEAPVGEEHAHQQLTPKRLALAALLYVVFAARLIPVLT